MQSSSNRSTQALWIFIGGVMSLIVLAVISVAGPFSFGPMLLPIGTSVMLLAVVVYRLTRRS